MKTSLLSRYSYELPTDSSSSSSLPGTNMKYFVRNVRLAHEAFCSKGTWGKEAGS
jgi:hypothetical protein